jgi:hypothetical protein
MSCSYSCPLSKACKQLIIHLHLAILQQSGQVSAGQAAAPGGEHACNTVVLTLLLWLLFLLCSKAAKSVRHKLPHQAVSTLAQMVARDKRMADDVSIIILDMLPPPAPGIMPQQFPASVLKVSSSFLQAFLVWYCVACTLLPVRDLSCKMSADVFNGAGVWGCFMESVFGVLMSQVLGMRSSSFWTCRH